MRRLVICAATAGLAILALPVASGSAAAAAQGPNLVTICLHVGGDDIQIAVSEQAALRLWERGIATLGPCDDGGGGGN